MCQRTPEIKRPRGFPRPAFEPVGGCFALWLFSVHLLSWTFGFWAPKTLPLSLCKCMVPACTQYCWWPGCCCHTQSDSLEVTNIFRCLRGDLAPHHVLETAPPTTIPACKLALFWDLPVHCDSERSSWWFVSSFLNETAQTALFSDVENRSILTKVVLIKLVWHPKQSEKKTPNTHRFPLKVGVIS